MKLHDLQPNKGSHKKRTRVGRGISAGKGKTAGRGTKGAGARGRHARKGPYFEGGQLPLVRRLPFKRGFTNLFRIEFQEVKIAQLDQLAAGTVVTPALLKAQGWIRDEQNPVVILGNGDLTKALTVQAHRFTKSAQEKIAKAGGTTTIITLPVTGARLTIKRLSRAKLAKLMAQSQS
ncbi:MAG: 50S ribosomal protein L15 [Anaerolineae bacterium]|nr:50S ribosomal protein L15 [Anaerolineae bacterium]